MSVYLDTLNIWERPQPTEQHEEVEIFERKKIKVGQNLTEAVRHDVFSTIAKFRDIFAFSIEEMPRYSTQHHVLQVRHQTWIQTCQAKATTPRERKNRSC